MRLYKYFTICLLTIVMMLSSCNTTKQSTKNIFKIIQDRNKISEDFIVFDSSDKKLNEFLNDFLKRHLRYDENRIGKIPLGNAVMFDKEWETQSLMWFDTTSKTVPDDRFIMIKKWLESVPVDKFGYVWSSMDDLQPTTAGPKSFFGQGWPFPDYSNSRGKSKGWEFNSPTAEGWKSNADAISVAGGTLSFKCKTTDTCEFESPDINVNSFQSPFLELDIRMTANKPDNVDDIAVYWQTKDDPAWSTTKSASQREWSTLPVKDIPMIYAKHLYFPLYLHPLWKDKMITKLKIVVKGKERLSINGDLNFIRMNYDTRHSDNSTQLISSAKTYYEFTGDNEFLKKNLNRFRQAMQFMLTHLNGENGLVDLSYFVGHDGKKGIGHGIGNGYFDIFSTPPVSFYTNLYFYRAVEALSYLEKQARDNGIIIENPAVVKSDNKGMISYNQTPESLDALLDKIKTRVQSTFWNEEKGRFVEGYNSANEIVDYGFLSFNIEGIASGIATDKQEKAIMEWVTGKREITTDTSVGKDIYANVFAPRITTKKNFKTYIWEWGGTNKFGDQVQDGGSILFSSYYDLMSRKMVYGSDNSYERLKEIEAWYFEVKSAGGEKEKFYRDYYIEKGVELQGGGTAGGLGIDEEFLESALLYNFIPYGILGIGSEKKDTLNICPDLPSKLKYFTVENLKYHKVKYDLSVGSNFVNMSSVRGDINGLKINVKIKKQSENYSVYVNGKIVKNYKEINGFIEIEVPFTNIVVAVV